MMGKVDWRKANRDERLLMRRTALALLQRGYKQAEILKELGCSRTGLYGWIKLYYEGGWKALEFKGHVPKRHKLDVSDRIRLLNLLVDNSPKAFGLDGDLWSKRLLRQLIEREFAITFSISSLRRLLIDEGLTRINPLKRLMNTNRAIAAKWKSGEFAEIQKMAKMEKAKIFFVSHNPIGERTKNFRDAVPSEFIKSRNNVKLLFAAPIKGETHFLLIKGDIKSIHIKSIINNVAKRIVGKSYYLLAPSPVIGYGDGTGKKPLKIGTAASLFFLPTSEKNVGLSS